MNFLHSSPSPAGLQGPSGAAPASETFSQECDTIVLTTQYRDLTVPYCELSDMTQNFLLYTGLFQEETLPRKDRTLPLIYCFKVGGLSIYSGCLLCGPVPVSSRIVYAMRCT